MKLKLTGSPVCLSKICWRKRKTPGGFETRTSLISKSVVSALVRPRIAKGGEREVRPSLDSQAAISRLHISADQAVVNGADGEQAGLFWHLIHAGTFLRHLTGGTRWSLRIRPASQRKHFPQGKKNPKKNGGRAAAAIGRGPSRHAPQGAGSAGAHKRRRHGEQLFASPSTLGRPGLLEARRARNERPPGRRRRRENGVCATRDKNERPTDSLRPVAPPVSCPV